MTLDRRQPDLLERLPRLVGLAFDQWRENVLEALLKRLLENEAARTDALFELGQVTLRTALNGGSIEAVMAGVIEARERFAAAEASGGGPGRCDHYRSAPGRVRGVRGLAVWDGWRCVGTRWRRCLTQLAAERLTPHVGAGWLGCAEATGRGRVVRVGEYAASRGWPSGAAVRLTPGRLRSKVLAAYQASRSVTVVSADGFRIVLEPTVEAAFLRREGLVEHLRAALNADEVSDVDVDAARGDY